MRSLRGVGRRLGANGVRVIKRARARSLYGAVGTEGNTWLLVRLGAQLSERRVSAGLGSSEPPPLALVDLLRTFEVAGADSRVAGVLLRFEGGPPGVAAAEPLRRAVESLRAAGKTVWAWSEGYDALSYYVASAADRVDVAPTGSLQLLGLRSQQPFFKGLLDKLGVRAEVVRIGSNKAAADPLVRRAMAEPQREQVTAYQSEVFEELVRAIASGRGLSEESVRGLIDEGPHGAEAACRAGLFDALRYPDEVDASLREAFGQGSGDVAEAADADAFPLVEGGAYFGWVASDAGWRPVLHELPRVAYVVVEGAIRKGRSARGVSSQRYSELFRKLKDDEQVSGVIVRIASPGGDAVASDLLHREIERLSRRKPVVVSMADVAASGGYYLAVAGDHILAEKTTLTGSIGVVGGKLDLSGLYARLGIDFESIERGERAGLYSETRGFTPAERQALRAEMQTLYEAFKERVAAGRSLSERDVERAAQGRVWSGARARGLGLVDDLGGPLEALAKMRARLALAPGAGYLLDVYPQRRLFPLAPEWFSSLVWGPRRANVDWD